MGQGVSFPFGSASTASLSATGAQAITISDQLTIIDGATTQATGNRTINLTISAGVKAGAMILATYKTQGTETTTLGTGIDAATITGVAGKTFSQGYMYNGTVFLPFGTANQID